MFVRGILTYLIERYLNNPELSSELPTLVSWGAKRTGVKFTADLEAGYWGVICYLWNSRYKTFTLVVYTIYIPQIGK